MKTSTVSKKKTTAAPKLTTTKVETRGRKPMDAQTIKSKTWDEFAKLSLKLEKEIFRSLPEKQSDIRKHVLLAARRVVA